MNSLIRSILLKTKNIVIIGASSNPKKDSYIFIKYLQGLRLKVISINSKTSLTSILGEKVYKDIGELNIDIDIVNIFKPSSEVYKLINKIINKKVKTVWLQLEIFCSGSESKLDHLGINFIQNRCTKIEFEKLLSKS